MAIKMAVIDGTGPSEKYDESMVGSFCSVLAKAMGENAYYQRGPTAAGMQVPAEAGRAANWLRQAKAADPSAQLMLAGYSRGGSAAIMAAQLLEHIGIEVHSLFLFDAVARHVFPGGEVIPANVQFSRAARRDQSWSWVMKWEGTITDGAGATSNPTRPSFGNTGLTWRGFGDHKPAEVFTGTHGALGGVGWGFVKSLTPPIDYDKQCMLFVSQYMRDQMKARGLTVDLGPGTLNTIAPLSAGRVTKFAGQVLDASMIGKSAVNRAVGGWRGL